MSDHLMIADRATQLGHDYDEWAIANGLARRAGEPLLPRTGATWSPDTSWLFASPLDEDPDPTPDHLVIAGRPSKIASLHQLPIFGAMWKADGRDASR